MPLICPRCEQDAATHDRSTLAAGERVRATGRLVDKVILGRTRKAAELVCEDCRFAWTSIRPEAVALAEQVQRGEVTYTEHEQPVDVEF